MNEPDLTPQKHAGADFEPTPADRKRVRNAVGYGLTNEMISKLIINPETSRPITKKTLAKHFADEIETGQAERSEAVAHTIASVAVDTGHPKWATAAIFYAKCKMGWREADKVETPTGTPPQVVIQVRSEEEGIRVRERMGLDSATISQGSDE